MGGGYEAIAQTMTALPPPPATAPGQKGGRSPKTAASLQAPASGQKDNKDKSRRTYLDKQLRKTKMCVYHLRGACQYSTNCDFAHSVSELHGLPDLSNTRLCKAFVQGGCSDPNCAFAHGEEALRSTNMFFKKTLCIWYDKGKCRNGDQCRFAHGNSEVRNTQEGKKSISTKESCPPILSSAPPSPNYREVANRRKEREQQELEEQQLQYIQDQLMATSSPLPPIMTSAEPMKVQSSLVNAVPIGEANPHDDSLNDQLLEMKQLMSALSLKCNQLQAQVDSSWNLALQPDMQFPPGLDQPFFL